jgi:uncharacterized protein
LISRIISLADTLKNMKTKYLQLFVLIFSIATVIKVVAQQIDADKFNAIKAKAENGDAPSQCDLGDCYANGKGVATNYVEAYKWYNLAAAEGQANANSKRFALAFQMTSDQIAEAQQLSLKAWTKPMGGLIADIKAAAENGDALAQIALGYEYFKGEKIPRNDKEVIKWTRKAAEQGNAEAQVGLGTYYEASKVLGFGMPEDQFEAVKWYRKAAEQGNAKAQYSLGIIYSDSKGIAQDYVEAVKWFRILAEQGDPNAQYRLGLCYVKGQGVPQNDVQAYCWLSLAAAQIDIVDWIADMPIHAGQVRDNLGKRMSREEIVEGQQKAAAFVPSGQKQTSDSDISKPKNKPNATGSGFFITDNGYFISNNHVVKDATKVRIVTSAGTFDAKIIQTDAANDLALLKVAGRFSPLPIAASRTVKLGATVATVGFPDPTLQGFSPKLAKGDIGSLAGIQDDPRYFQISLPVQHGNSGGALVDVHGNVVGIVAARLGVEIGKAVTSDELPENVNYAVKSSLLLSFLESVPDMSAKLKDPNTKDEAFEDVVKSAQDAAVLVLVY